MTQNYKHGMKMVLVKVSGEVYTLSDVDICGSKTIELLLDTCQADEHTPITIDVFSCQDWCEYLNFLKHGVVTTSNNLSKLDKCIEYDISQTSIATLKIIDYLDNLQQGQQWCKLEYKRYTEFKQTRRRRNSIESTNSSDSDNSSDCSDYSDDDSYYESAANDHWDKMNIRDKLVSVINMHTAFNPCQLLPVELLIKFEDVLSSIKVLGDKEISNNFVKHIVNNLFGGFVKHNYYTTCYKRSMNDISKYHIQDLESYKVILKPSSSSSIQLDDYIVDNDRILNEYENFYYCNTYSPHQVLLQECDAKFISKRIAQYYPDIIVDSISDSYLLCPSDKPYLWWKKSERQISTETVITVISVTCYDQPPPSLQQLLNPQQSQHTEDTNDTNNILLHSKLTKPVNTLYCPNSKYKPRDGFQTGIKIKDLSQDGNTTTNCNSYYDVLSYNKPSTYDRDYYIFLPYEYDPIAKVVYAFSV